MAQLIDKFYLYLQEEVAVRQAASEEGDSQEQAVTRNATEVLFESGGVEGVAGAYVVKEIGKKGQYVTIHMKRAAENFLNCYDGFAGGKIKES